MKIINSDFNEQGGFVEYSVDIYTTIKINFKNIVPEWKLDPEEIIDGEVVNKASYYLNNLKFDMDLEVFYNDKKITINELFKMKYPKNIIVELEKDAEFGYKDWYNKNVEYKSSETSQSKSGTNSKN